MRNAFLFFCVSVFVIACNDSTEKTAATTATDPGTSTAAPTDLAYTAKYSSSWSTDVSDADLKMVLMTYKDWENGNIEPLSKAMGDSVIFDMSSGVRFEGTNAELTKRWSTYRDSLSSVKIEMHAWQKMYSTDKKQAHVVVWYDEWDTYKDGRVDSATYHDINRVKDGKIVWYSQYKRPLMPRK